MYDRGEQWRQEEWEELGIILIQKALGWGERGQDTDKVFLQKGRTEDTKAIRNQAPSWHSLSSS